MTKNQLVVFVPTVSVVLLIILLSLLFARHHSPLIFARYVGDNGTPDRAAWLSTQARRDDYYPYLDGPTIVPEFLQIIQKLYGASHYSLPDGLLWEGYFNDDGKSFSVRQKVDNCIDEHVKEYRLRATQSLLYSPLVFGVDGDRHSSGAPVTPSEWELFKSRHRLEKYPTAMLFIPRENESDLVDVLKCRNYLVFLPKKKKWEPLTNGALALNLLPGSLLSVAAMYLWGLLVATYFWRNSILIHRIVIAFPVGYGTWGTIWVGVKLACHPLACAQAPGPEITGLAMLVYLVVAGMLTVFVLSGKMINWAEWQTILGGATVLLALSTFYFFISYAILTPDSFSSVNWARDVPLALKEGFPLINLANANLSTLIGADYYLYVVHPLLAISLLLLVAGSILGRQTGSPGLGIRIARLVTIIGLLLVFSINWMFGMQTFYVNHHVLTAINFLIVALVLFERDNLDVNAVIFVAILSVVITLSRMEGFLFVVLALSIFVFLLPNRRDRTRLVGAVLVFSLPYLTYMITTMPAGSFVDGRQYAVMLAAALALHFAVRLNLHGRYCNQKTVGPIVALGLIAILMLMILIKPTHMLASLMTFKKNLLVYEDWGASILLVLVATPCLWIYRIFTRGYFFRHDAFFYFFASALVLIVILTFYRNPLGNHAYDSANRMVFHFLPLAYVWIGLEISRILQNGGPDADKPTSA